MRGYAPRPEQLQHFLDAIPNAGEVPLSANQIFNRQEKMRLRRRDVVESLYHMVYQGTVECTQAGFMDYFRKRTRGRNIAITPEFAYNPARRNEFPLDKDIDPFLQALNPLRLGKVALLWMDDPLPQKKTTQSTPKKTLVIIVPGQLVLLPKSSVLISLVGKGSCVMRLGEPKNVAGLVLAGMPSKLARELSTRINRVLQGA